MEQHRDNVRRLSGLLYLICAAIVAFVSALPGVDHGHRIEISAIVGAATVAGILAWIIPWQRFHHGWFFVNVFISTALLSMLVEWTGGIHSPFLSFYVFLVLTCGAYYDGLLLIGAILTVCLGILNVVATSVAGSLDLAPAILDIFVLVSVAVVCNILYRQLDLSVQQANLRSGVIAALANIDQFTSTKSEHELILFIETRTREIFGCVDVHIQLVAGETPDRHLDVRSTACQRILVLEREGKKLGTMALSWLAERNVPEDGTLKHYAAQIALVLENGRLEREAEKARVLSEVQRLKDDVFAVVSHELRSPLMIINGYCDLLLSDTVEPDRRLAALQRIQSAGGQLERLADDLLDLARLESGQLQIYPRVCNLAILVRQVVDSVAGLQGQHVIDLDVQRSDIVLSVDEKRLYQILSNLLGNAIRYSPQGGSVVVSVTRDSQWARVTVADGGIGMSPETLAHVFDRFYRSPAVIRKIRGSGIGLALCRGLVEAHGGQIWAESEGEGKGSRFTFTLPLLEGTEAGN